MELRLLGRGRLAVSGGFCSIAAPPLPPRLLEDAPPGGWDPVPFPELSSLAERLNTCLPSVRGGGGFITAVLAVLLPPGGLEASAERPTSLEPEGGGGFTASWLTGAQLGTGRPCV